VEQPEAQPSEVIQSAHRRDGSRLSPALDRHGPVLATLVLVAVVAVYGWSLWHDRELERQRAGAVEVSVEAPLPFSADSGAAEGILRLRNDGPLPLGVLSLGFKPGGLRLVTENLPLRVDAAGSRLVVVRLEIDCTVLRDETGPQSLQLRARTEDDRERVTAVRVKPLESILTKLRREACDPPLLPIAEDLTLAYAGISAVSDGRITTRVLARNERDTAVTVVRISSVSGWPALDAAASTQLPVTVPAHGRLPLDLGWDVSRCVRSESGRFSTGLHLHLGPPAGTEELAVLEPGIDYTRDFFSRYAEVCP
jgi:hypothetical protein